MTKLVHDYQGAAEFNGNRGNTAGNELAGEAIFRRIAGRILVVQGPIQAESLGEMKAV